MMPAVHNFAALDPRIAITPTGKRIETPRVRRSRGSREARELLADLETLLAAAALEQWRFFRARRQELLEAARRAFALQSGDFSPALDSGLLRRHQERLAQLYAAARALGWARVQAVASDQASFAEVLGGVPPREAIRYLERLPAVPRSRWEEFIRQSRRQAFTVSGIEQQAALESLQRLVVESLRSGITPEQFGNSAQDLLRNFEVSASRLRTVWNTSVANAIRQGDEAAFEDPAVAALLTHGLFDAINDNVVRENHQALDGAIASRSWWLEHQELMPLLGFNCRCTIIWISGARARHWLAEGGGRFDIEAEGIPALAGRDEGFPVAA